MQADSVGVGSLPIVILTGFFTGAVLALQTSSTLQQFGSLSLTGKLVSLSMVRELGPVLTGLMVAGRNATGMASELGSMKVSEQIDAMRAMGVDPTKKLVTPRVVASVVMMFFLSIISDLVGLAGGFVISYFLLGLDANQYWTTAYQALRFGDVFMGLGKPVVFGFIIASIGCYYGMSAKRWHARRGPGHQAIHGRCLSAAHRQRFLHHPAAHGIFPVLAMSSLAPQVEQPESRISRPDEPVITFEDVEIAFDHPVLEGISFQLPRGETKILLGTAGTGKTLILKLALGLIKPDAGRITVLGEEVTQMREQDLFELRRKIGMVFQESALFDSLTVEENVAYRLIEETGRITDEIHARVLEALRFVELEHTVNLFPVGTFRRHAAKSGHRARDHHSTRDPALRFSDRRTRPRHLKHHH